MQEFLQLYSTYQSHSLIKVEKTPLKVSSTESDDLIAIKQLKGKDGISVLHFIDYSLARSYSFIVFNDFSLKLNNFWTLISLDVVFV
jgi:hypothetical protein